jgi:hypothetical protein
MSGTRLAWKRGRDWSDIETITPPYRDNATWLAIIAGEWIRLKHDIFTEVRFVSEKPERLGGGEYVRNVDYILDGPYSLTNAFGEQEEEVYRSIKFAFTIQEGEFPQYQARYLCDLIEPEDLPGPGGGLVIPYKHWFSSVAARDDYFQNNPDEIYEGMYCAVTSSTYRLTLNDWQLVVPCIQGPKGEQGEKGDPGPTLKLTIGSVVCADEGTPPNVLLSEPQWSGGEVVRELSFILPKGPKGEKGDTGAQGEKGDTGWQGQPGRDGIDGQDGAPGKDGLSASVAVGEVRTVTPSSPARVINVGTPLEAILDFEIPKGADGGEVPPTTAAVAGDVLTVINPGDLPAWRAAGSGGGSDTTVFSSQQDGYLKIEKVGKPVQNLRVYAHPGLGATGHIPLTDTSTIGRVLHNWQYGIKWSSILKTPTDNYGVLEFKAGPGEGNPGNGKMQIIGSGQSVTVTVYDPASSGPVSVESYAHRNLVYNPQFKLVAGDPDRTFNPRPFAAVGWNTLNPQGPVPVITGNTWNISSGVKLSRSPGGIRQISQSEMICPSHVTGFGIGDTGSTIKVTCVVKFGTFSNGCRLNVMIGSSQLGGTYFDSSHATKVVSGCLEIPVHHNVTISFNLWQGPETETDIVHIQEVGLYIGDVGPILGGASAFSGILGEICLIPRIMYDGNHSYGIYKECNGGMAPNFWKHATGEEYLPMLDASHESLMYAMRVR